MRINSRHTDAERGDDAYFTPPEATRALLAIEDVPRSVADPACGAGAILEVCKAAGYTVYGSDIINYGWPHTIVRDYLAAPIHWGDVGLVTNPPYKMALEFVQKAVTEGAPFAAFLLRINFLESARRKPFFEKHPPAKVWVSSRRLPMMHRLGWTGPIAPSNCCYAWFIWKPGVEETRVSWFDWAEHSPTSAEPLRLSREPA
jgi:hypothetical protein